MLLRAPRRGGAGGRAAVATVTRGRKMVRKRPYVSCPSFPKVSTAYFFVTLLNKSGLLVASARKV